MNWVQGFYAGILSLLLIFVYEKYKSIIAPIILHMTANTISVLVTILSGELENAAEGTEKIDFNIGIVVFDIFLLAIMFVVIKLIDKVVKRKETYAEYKFVGYGYNGENFQIDNNYYGDINGGMNSIDSNEDRYKDLWESNINAGVNGTDKKEDGDYE